MIALLVRLTVIATSVLQPLTLIYQIYHFEDDWIHHGTAAWIAVWYVLLNNQWSMSLTICHEVVFIFSLLLMV